MYGTDSKKSNCSTVGSGGGGEGGGGGGDVVGGDGGGAGGGECFMFFKSNGYNVQHGVRDACTLYFVHGATR